MSKVSISVAKTFSLILKPGDPPLVVPAGVQQVDKAVAEHWYTKLHLANGGFGTPEYAAAAREAADAAFCKADDAVKAYQSLEDACHDAERAADLDPSEPAHVRLRQFTVEAVHTPVEDDKGGKKKSGKAKAPEPPVSPPPPPPEETKPPVEDDKVETDQKDGDPAKDGDDDKKDGAQEQGDQSQA